MRPSQGNERDNGGRTGLMSDFDAFDLQEYPLHSARSFQKNPFEVNPGTESPRDPVPSTAPMLSQHGDREQGSIDSNNSDDVESSPMKRWWSSVQLRLKDTTVFRLLGRIENLLLGNTTGWRRGLRANTWLAAFVGLINLLTAIIVPTLHGRDGDGMSYVMEGNCATVSRTILAIHVVINILSTLLLAASNFTMQVLVSPTRSQIDAAHRDGSWLDIGIPSLRNVPRLSAGRFFLWALIAISSVPLHLLYNSAFFESITAYEYSSAIVTEEFFNVSAPLTVVEGGYVGVPFGNNSTEDLLRWQNQAVNNDLHRYEPKDCMSAFATNYVTDHSLILLVSNQTVLANRTIIEGATDDTDDLANVLYVEESWLPQVVTYGWICGYTDEDDFNDCTLAKAQANANDWEVETWHISYCLLDEIPEMCQLNFNLTILVIVIVANFCKLIVMLMTAKAFTEAPLVTIGDAIASFLSDPDQTTVGMCLLNKNKVTSGSKYQAGRVWHSRRYRWFRASSASRWIITNLLCLAGIVLGIYYYHLAYSSLGSFSLVKQLGMGQISSATVLSLDDLTPSLIDGIMLANTPQFIFSCLYLTYNGLFTAMVGAAEWDGFGHSRKVLRVTAPSGKQQSTYWLQLPYRWAIPLMALSILIHWLISESLFFTQINVYFPDGSESDNSISMPEYSLLPMMIALIVCAFALLLANVIGFFCRYSGTAPLVGNYSVTLSAACHTDPENTSTAPYGLLKWGVIKPAVGDEVGHCGLSSYDVDAPEVGKMYAGTQGESKKSV